MAVTRGDIENVRKSEVRSQKSDTNPQTSNFRLRTSGLRIVELHVPVQVVAPAVGRVSETDCDADGRRRIGPLGHPLEMHAGFSRRAPTFLAIARHAAGD